MEIARIGTVIRLVVVVTDGRSRTCKGAYIRINCFDDKNSFHTVRESHREYRLLLLHFLSYIY